MKSFRHAPYAILEALFFNIISWLLSLSVSYLVFLSIHPSIFETVHWSVIIVTWSIVVAVRAIPLGVPFEAGLPEITMSAIYSAFMPEYVAIGATATILIRLLTVWLRFFIGFSVQQLLGIEAMAITNQKKTPARELT
jgi:hypothetical protein